MSTEVNIAALNDAARRDFTCHVHITSGIAALPSAEQTQILTRVREFDTLDADNDPHGEHDFGSFEHCGEAVFWKIDYYDPSGEFGSEDPADPSKTKRVLTILLASEY